MKVSSVSLEGRGEDVKLPVPIEGIGDKVLDQLISIGEN